jgi:hypothetical protein
MGNRQTDVAKQGSRRAAGRRSARGPDVAEAAIIGKRETAIAVEMEPRSRECEKRTVPVS